MELANGKLNLTRLDGGPISSYEVSFACLGGWMGKPWRVKGATALIDLLEQLGVDFSRPVVRAALEDLLHIGRSSIPEVTLSQEELLRLGLAGPAEARAAAQS